MKIKILAGILVFLIVLNLVTIGSYVYFRWMAPQRPPMMMPPMMREHWMRHHPRFTPEQREKMRELHQQFLEEIAGDREAIFTLRREILEMLKQDTVDTALLARKLDSISIYRGRIERKGLEMLYRTRHILPFAQRQEFYRMLERVGGFYWHRPGMHAPRFPSEPIPPEPNLNDTFPNKPFHQPKPQRRMP